MDGGNVFQESPLPTPDLQGISVLETNKGSFEKPQCLTPSKKC